MNEIKLENINNKLTKSNVNIKVQQKNNDIDEHKKKFKCVKTEMNDDDIMVKTVVGKIKIWINRK